MNCIFFWLHSSRGTGCHFVLGSFWLKPNLEEQDDSEFFFSNTANCDTQKWWAISAMVKQFLFTLETDSPSGAKLDVNGVPKIGYAWLVPQKHHGANDPTPIQQQFWDMPLEKDVPCFEIHVYIYVYLSFSLKSTQLFPKSDQHHQHHHHPAPLQMHWFWSVVRSLVRCDVPWFGRKI